jgi:NTE family protein
MPPAQFKENHRVPESSKVVDVVIQGTGTKAAGALGAVMALHEAGYRFHRMSGTSSGAIVAALVMAYQTVDRDMHELENVMQSLDYSQMVKASLLERLTGVAGEAFETILHGGAYTVGPLRDWLAEELAKVGISKFGDLRQADPDSSLPESYRYSLVVHASDLSRRCWVRCPWDYPKYGLNPDDQLIADAVSASFAFPGAFVPVDVKTGSGEIVSWTDGGLVADYPLDVFDRTDGKASRWPTWGVRLFGPPPLTSGAVHSAPEIVGRSLLTMLEWYRYGIDEEGPTQRTIAVGTATDSPTLAINMNVSVEDREALFKTGQQAARKFLDNLSQHVQATLE